MSARSSLPELCIALALVACSSKSKQPEADPAQVKKLAATIVKNIPLPGGRVCAYDELIGGATLTRRTAFQLADQPLSDAPELFEYVNPSELDSPAARTLIDSTDATARGQAAAQLLSAPFYLVYYIDLVDAPIPLGVKDHKRATVGARALRFDKAGNLSCVFVFFWGNTKEKHDWAVARTNKPKVDPEVQKEMQLDLRAQMLRRIAGLGAPFTDEHGGVDDRPDRQQKP